MLASVPNIPWQPKIQNEYLKSFPKPLTSFSPLKSVCNSLNFTLLTTCFMTSNANIYVNDNITSIMEYVSNIIKGNLTLNGSQ